MITSERAPKLIPLPIDIQNEADVAPILEIDKLGQKRRLSSCRYNWVSVHIRDIDDINRGIDPDND